MAKPAKTQTTTRKKTTKTAKAPTAAPRAAKASVAKAVTAAKPKPVVVTETTPVVADPAMKKKELIEAIVERSGIKKKDAKPVIEAMLDVLGKTLAEGRELNLQPLGKIKVNRTKDVQGGKVIIAKIRQSNRVPQPATPAAAE